MPKPNKTPASKSTKDKMAANAKVIQSAKKPSPAKPAAAEKPLVVLPPEKPIIPAKGDVGDIMRKCLELSPDHRFVTNIKVDTTKQEFLAIFDNFQGEGESWQFRLGSLIFHGMTLKAFGGDDKFAAAMVASGRGIDSCKAYLSTFVNTPIEYLKKGIPYTAARATVKVKDKDKKIALLDKIVAAEKSGEPMTVDEVKKEADKAAPKKKTAAQKPREYKELSADETTMLEAFTGIVTEMHAYMAAMSFLKDAKPAVTAKLRAMLADMSKFSAKLEA